MLKKFEIVSIKFVKIIENFKNFEKLKENLKQFFIRCSLFHEKFAFINVFPLVEIISNALARTQ